MKKEKKGNKISTGKILLVLLTIFILGPLVFVGACFPIGLIGVSLGSMNFSIIFACIIGLALAFWVVYKVIQVIKKS